MPAVARAKGTQPAKAVDESPCLTSNHPFQRDARCAALVKWTTYAVLFVSIGFPVWGAKFHDGSPRPLGLALTNFDGVFKYIGPLFPLFPWALRWAASVGTVPLAQQLSDASPLVAPAGALTAHFAFQALRFMLYGAHMAGQTSGLWLILTGAHADHIMADHILLGVAVESSLACELAVTGFLLWQRLAAKGRSGVQGPSPRLLGLAYVLAWTLLVLTSANMYNTARWFHSPSESLAALGLGCACFMLPAVSLIMRLSVSQAS